eukprot:470845_1
MIICLVIHYYGTTLDSWPSTSSWHSNPFLLATNDAMCLNDFASALFGGQTMNDLTVPLIQMPYIFYLRKFIIDLKRWIIRISLSYFLHICVYFDPNYMAERTLFRGTKTSLFVHLISSNISPCFRLDNGLTKCKSPCVHLMHCVR